MKKGLNFENGDLIISSGAEYYQSRLERLLFSEVGVMIGALNKGSKLNQHFGKPLNRMRSLAILREARDLIVKYEPDLTLKSIGVKIIDLNGERGIVIATECIINETEEIIENEFIKIREV